jgi:hypothetical protein
MSGVSSLVEKTRERLALENYTAWERSFLVSIIRVYDDTGTLTERQTAKLKEIVLERWVQGKRARV